MSKHRSTVSSHVHSRSSCHDSRSQTRPDVQTPEHSVQSCPSYHDTRRPTRPVNRTHEHSPQSYPRYRDTRRQTWGETQTPEHIVQSCLTYHDTRGHTQACNPQIRSTLSSHALLTKAPEIKPRLAFKHQSALFSYAANYFYIRGQTWLEAQTPGHKVHPRPSYHDARGHTRPETQTFEHHKFHSCPSCHDIGHRIWPETQTPGHKVHPCPGYHDTRGHS